MIKLYILPNCPACDEARDWLTENALEFEERNLISCPLSIMEVKCMLQWLEEGISEIVNAQLKKLEILRKQDLDNMCILEFCRLIQKKPRLLKVPLIMDDMRLIIGLDFSELHLLLPKCIRSAKRLGS